MERRNRLEITAEILRLAKKGVRKTHIVYGANLNHAILEGYLDKLEEQGLIAKDLKRGNGVRTTPKGLEFVEQYRSLQTLANF